MFFRTIRPEIFLLMPAVVLSSCAFVHTTNGSYENVVIQERAQNEKQTIKWGVYAAEESVTELGCELSLLFGPKTSSLV